jgi:DNA-binding GntR family transcriptional regulator
VASPQIEEISGFLTTALTLLAGTPEMPVAELLEARETLEVPAARMAAWRASDEALEAIGKLVPNDSASVGTQEMFRANWEFHETILKASGNRWLYVMAKPLFTSMQTRFVRTRATQSFWEKVVEEHLLVQQAIALRDGEGAAEAMMLHLEGLAPFYRSIDQDTA